MSRANTPRTYRRNIIYGLTVLWVGLATGIAARSDDSPRKDRVDTKLTLQRIGGWVMLPDGVTLIVALPEQAKLAYVDTVAEKELKRVELPFKPDLVAMQGKHLFVSVYGGSSIHALDYDSGVNRKEIRLPAGPPTGLVCHRDKGLLFASIPDPSMVGAIVGIDPNSGAIAYGARVDPLSPVPVKVSGQILGADPLNPEGFYSLAVWSAGRHVTPGLSIIRASVKSTGPYQHYNEMQLMAMPPIQRFQYIHSYQHPQHRDVPPGLAAFVGEYELGSRVAKLNSPVHASADGKQVGVIDYDGNGVEVLSALKPNERVGKMDCKSTSDFAFHPVLDLAVAEGEGTDRKKQRALILFNSKPLAEVDQISLGHGPVADDDKSGHLLTFGARGTKLVYFDAKQGKHLRFFPLKLTEKEQETLTKAYSGGHKR